jgi:ABC-2 type transport system permease protein
VRERRRDAAPHPDLAADRRGGALGGRARAVHRRPLRLALFPLAVFGAWLISFLVQALVASLAFRFDNSSALFELWLGLYALLSGYLIPLELFPGWLHAIVRWLPFRYMLSFPVELLLGLGGRAQALADLVVQWAFVAALLLAVRSAWRGGVRRFQAFGG